MLDVTTIQVLLVNTHVIVSKGANAKRRNPDVFNEKFPVSLTFNVSEAFVTAFPQTKFIITVVPSISEKLLFIVAVL